MKIAIQTAPQPLEQMQLLFRLATAVSHTQDPAEIYRAAVEGLTQLLGADRAAVRVFDSDGVLRFEEWKGLSERFRTEVEPHSAWPQGLADAEPIVAADVQEEGPVSRYRPNFEREGIRAVAFIPLLANGGVVGEFTLYYDQPHEFSSEEMQLTQMIGAHLAFTAERQNAAAALRATEERFRVMFLQASVGIAQIGPDGEYLAVNDRYCAILGYTQAELQEKSPVDIEHPEDREVGRTIRRRFIAEGAPFYTRETRFIRKDESIIWAKFTFRLPAARRDALSTSSACWRIRRRRFTQSAPWKKAGKLLP